MGATVEFAARALSIATALVLVAGAFDKLRDVAAFRDAVANYRVLPAFLVAPFALTMPLVEAVAGLGLLVEASRIPAAWIGVAAIAAATLGVAINVARGRLDIECGCGGLEGRQRLSWALVARNAALALVLGLGATFPAPHVDGFVASAMLVAAALAFVALFAAAGQLVANRPLLNELVRRP